MTLLSVAEALSRVVAGAAPVGTEAVALTAALGRALAEPIRARRDQPPFAASSMDGYALRAADAAAGATWRLAGESAAGRHFEGTVGPGETVRILTGAPVPDGADSVVPQENTRVAAGEVTIVNPVAAGRYIRPAGLDFRAGDVVLTPGRRLGARELALAASAGAVEAVVHRMPKVAILSMGDELVLPSASASPSPDQIFASAGAAVAAIAAQAGATAVERDILPDRIEPLLAAIAAERMAGTDILVTIGGASVGDHDLVKPALAEAGMTLDFWRIAMRPGRPLLSGRLDAMRVIGLPGNPVSAFVCSLIFLRPLIETLLGLPVADPTEPAVLGADVPANDGRQDYVRSRLTASAAGLPEVAPLSRQDSSMLGALASADCLLIRPPMAPAEAAGALCRVIRLDR